MEPILHRTALERGYTARALRSPELTHPTDGTSLHYGDSHQLDAVCATVALVLGHDAVFTHLTSAFLRGWWLPRIEPLPIIACTHGEAPHLDRRGVYVRRCNLPAEHREVRHGLPIASAEWTIVELAEHLSLIDLVVVIDCALHRGETSIDRIRSTMRKGRRGVRVLRQALALADGRSESPWETLLRLLHVLSGIAVEPQHELRDDGGEVVYRLDLLVIGTRRASEFDGADHRTRDGHRRDLRRERLLLRHGIERFGYCAPELRHESSTIIRDAEDALGWSHDPMRIKFWRHEFERSSFTPHGYGSLLRRLQRFVRITTPRASLSGAK
jgi:very-short-patch-repair endonuclease